MPPGGKTGEQWCSRVSRAIGEDPIGTAAFNDCLVLVEMPLPWPARLERADGEFGQLSAIVARAEAAGQAAQLLAIAPDVAYSQPGQRRVLVVTRPEPPFAAFPRDEFLVPEGALFDLVETCLAGPEHRRQLGACRVDNRDTRDMLVCTHGSRDRCCATYGYPAYRHLRERTRAAGGSKVRVWRASHFGGHRFAPTIIDLPQGHAWAHVTPAAMDAVLGRKGPVAALRSHYRGWAGFTDPFLQAAEREAWEREGWPWLGYPKIGEVMAKDGSGDTATRTTVRIGFQRPGMDMWERFEARVDLIGELRTGGCSEGDGEPVPQYRVTDVMQARSNDNLPLGFGDAD